MLARLIEPRRSRPASRQHFSNRDLVHLIYPVVIEQFLALLVGMIDTMMISNAGESAVSGVALTNQLANVFILVFTSLAAGGAVVASQYVGHGDREKGVTASCQLLRIAGFVSLGISLVLFGLCTPVFDLLFGQVTPEVRSAGTRYLRIIICSFPFLALYNACTALYRSMSHTREVMYTSIIMNVLNVIGNAIGIFVLHAGVEGVAYPTLIARAVACLIMLFGIRNKSLTLHIDRGVLHPVPDMRRRILRIAIPNALEHGLFHVAKVALSSLVALFGTIQIAANGVAQSFWSMSFLFNNAMAPVFITVVGWYVGAGDLEGADYSMRKLLRITLLGSILWNVVFLALMPQILGLYVLTPATHALVVRLCLIHNMADGILCPVSYSFADGLKAAGDVKFNLYAGIFSTVVCRVILAWLLGLQLGLGVTGVAIAMVLDWAIKALLTLVRYRSQKWTRFHVLE